MLSTCRVHKGVDKDKHESGVSLLNTNHEYDR